MPQNKKFNYELVAQATDAKNRVVKLLQRTSEESDSVSFGVKVFKALKTRYKWFDELEEAQDEFNERILDTHNH